MRRLILGLLLALPGMLLGQGINVNGNATGTSTGTWISIPTCTTAIAYSSSAFSCSAAFPYLSTANSFANTLAFTTGQTNQSQVWNGNSINFTTEFQNFQAAFLGAGSYYSSDEADIGLNVPNTSSAFSSAVLGLYQTCASTTTDCEPIYTQGHRAATGAPVWGGNFNAWDGGFGGANMFGIEVDSFVGNASTTGEAIRVLVSNGSGATYQGLHFADDLGQLTNAILIDNSAATTAINIGAAVSGGGSMPIVMNNGGVSGTFYLDSNNSFDFNQPVSINNGASSSSVSMGFNLASGLSNGGEAYQCIIGTSVGGNYNCVYNAFHYTSSASSSNWYGISFAGVTTDNVAMFTNSSTTFGETSPAAGPNDGIAVGTTGQFQVDGSGNVTGPTVNVANSTVSAYVNPFNIFDASLGSGDKIYMNLGHDQASADNAATWGFNYVGSGSTSNFTSFGFSGVATNNLSMTAGGLNGIEQNSPAYPLDVHGTINTDTAVLSPSVTDSGLTSGNAVCASTGGLLSTSCTINAATVNSNTFPTSAGFTSGGIPYFSSTSAEGSSALLTHYGVVYGGGAGTAPATTAASTTTTNALFATATSPAFRNIGTSDVSPFWYAAGGGTAQAQTVTLAPAATALSAGLEVRWLPTAANTAAAPTLAVNGLTAKSITKLGATALVAGDLTTTAIADAVYDGTQFELQNPQTTATSPTGSQYQVPIFNPANTLSGTSDISDNTSTQTVTAAAGTSQLGTVTLGSTSNTHGNYVSVNTNNSATGNSGLYVADNLGTLFSVTSTTSGGRKLNAQVPFGSYNGYTLYGAGLATEAGVINETGATASFTSTTLITTGQLSIGSSATLYRIDCFVSATAVTSSPTLTLSLTYADSVGSKTYSYSAVTLSTTAPTPIPSISIGNINSATAIAMSGTLSGTATYTLSCKGMVE